MPYPQSGVGSKQQLFVAQRATLSSREEPCFSSLMWLTMSGERNIRLPGMWTSSGITGGANESQN